MMPGHEIEFVTRGSRVLNDEKVFVRCSCGFEMLVAEQAKQDSPDLALVKVLWMNTHRIEVLEEKEKQREFNELGMGEDE